MNTPWTLLENYLAELSGEEDELDGDDGDAGEGGRAPKWGADAPANVAAPKAAATHGGRFRPGGLPAKGSAFQQGGELALGAAGQRSGIERASEAGKLAEFVEKYAEYYEGNPDILLKQIHQLDSLPSDQVAMRIRSINSIIGKIHSKARQHFKKAFKASLWNQKFPKHSEAELKSFIRKAKGSEKYESDAIARDKVDRLEKAMWDFEDEAEQKFAADNTAKELDREYTLVVGGRNAARQFGQGLGATAQSGEKGEKGITNVKRPGFGRGEAYVEPKDIARLTPKYADQVGVAPDPDAEEEKPKSSKGSSKMGKAASGPKSSKSMPGVRKPGQAVGSTSKAPQRIATPKNMESDDEIDSMFKDMKERFERNLVRIIEVAAADRRPHWSDEL